MARYEYNSTLEEIDVTPGQAFQYEEMASRLSSLPKTNKTSQVSNVARIKNQHGMYTVQFLVEGAWQYYTVEIAEGHPQAWWCFSYEEALTVVALAEWMSGLSATLQWVQDLILNEEIASASCLISGVIYYTDKSDQSERVARLLDISAEYGYKLADPACNGDCEWYPFQQITNIKLGEQHCEGWY